jgi:hypothetical protein
MAAQIVPMAGGNGDFRGFHLETQGPTGSFPARIIDVEDNFDVEVQKYGEPGVMERKNVTEFLVAYSADGQTHLCKTWEMTQSASERSALYKFLRDMKGEPPVFDGSYDWADEVGQTLQATIASRTSKMGKTYTCIASVAPLMEELADKAPKLEDVEVPGGRRVSLKSNPENDPFQKES